MAPFGRQWFSLQDSSPAAIVRGLEIARPILDAFLDSELARRGLADRDLALVGFSQGTMLSLFTALRRPQACAAILGYSGLLAAPDRLPAELTARPPVLLVHGEQDPVVSYPFMGLAQSALQLMQVPVAAVTRPELGHSIDDEGLALGVRFLAEHFVEKQA
jgi:phospholipase/carboxylesterase